MFKDTERNGREYRPTVIWGDKGMTTRLKEGPAEGTTPGTVLDGFVSVSEAAAFLGLCRATIYSLCDRGELLYAKFGRSRRVPRRSLIAYAERCLTSTSVPA
jgi:excisionase family DNA binding protein